MIPLRYQTCVLNRRTPVIFGTFTHENCMQIGQTDDEEHQAHVEELYDQILSERLLNSFFGCM